MPNEPGCRHGIANYCTKCAAERTLNALRAAAEKGRKAIEWGEYLAKSSEKLMEAVNARDLLIQQIEEGDKTITYPDQAMDEANELVVEYLRSVRSKVYEFRKRVTP